MATLAAVQSVKRSVVEAFYKAYSERDIERIGQFLDDDVAWTISGPVDILPFCGQRVGKTAVMKLIDRGIPAILTDRRFVVNAMLVDGDRAAILGRVTATKSDGGHAISYRIAHFIRFRGEKVIDYTSIIDSFDAAEQVLGHRISLAADAEQPVDAGDMVAV
jgi:ketosteroid isomerase-like protein